MICSGNRNSQSLSREKRVQSSTKEGLGVDDVRSRHRGQTEPRTGEGKNRSRLLCRGWKRHRPQATNVDARTQIQLIGCCVDAFEFTMAVARYVEVDSMPPLSERLRQGFDRVLDPAELGMEIVGKDGDAHGVFLLLVI